MKSSISKEHTTLAQLPKVKEDLKEFKSRYTASDLWQFFVETVIDIDLPWNVDIIDGEIEAMPEGTDYNDETCFCVTLTAKGWKSFTVLHFYCDIDGKIDTRDLAFTPGTKLYSVERYKLA